jgi:hypothetical protein
MTRRQHRGELRTPDGKTSGSTGISTGALPPVAHATDHPGSKRWFTHLTQPARRSRITSPAEGQKSVPPQFVTDRTPLTPISPMSPQERWDRYTLGGTSRGLTASQRRRFRHKHGRRMLDVYEGHWRGQDITIVRDELSELA